MKTAYKHTQQNDSWFHSVNDMPLKTSHLAEVIVPSVNDSQSIVLPIVASLSQQTSERWLTWITHHTPSKAILSMFSANFTHLRIVHIKKNSDARWVIWQALAQGNSHTVIAEQSHWEDSDKMDMEKAARIGDSKAVFITHQ